MSFQRKPRSSAALIVVSIFVLWAAGCDAETICSLRPFFTGVDFASENEYFACLDEVSQSSFGGNEMRQDEFDCNNGTDDDLDGKIDCEDSDCANDSACSESDDNNPGAEICNNDFDDDGDGFEDCCDPDCAGQFPHCDQFHGDCP